MEVLVEDVAHDLDQEVGLAVQQSGGLHIFESDADRGPLGGEAVDIERELLVRRTLGGGAHDHADVVRQNLFENFFEARSLGVRELAADAVHRAVRHVHQIASGQADLARKTGALMADRILRHLHEHLVSWLEGKLDATSLTLAIGGVLRRGLPIHLARIENGVPAAPDVDERCFHAREYVLHPTEIHVANQAGIRGLGDIVLHQHAVFEYADLDAIEL